MSIIKTEILTTIECPNPKCKKINSKVIQTTKKWFESATKICRCNYCLTYYEVFFKTGKINGLSLYGGYYYSSSLKFPEKIDASDIEEYL